MVCKSFSGFHHNLIRLGVSFLTLLFGTYLQAAPFVYVANNGNNTVSVIDIATNTTVSIIPVEAKPAIISSNLDGTRVWVRHEDNRLSVIDVETNTVIGIESSLLEPVIVDGLSPDSTRYYAPNSSANTVSVIDETGSEIDTIAVGTNPNFSVVSPDNKYVFISNNGSDSISVIETSTNNVIETIAVGSNPFGLAVSPDSSWLYVVNSASSSVYVIDTINLNVVSEISVGQNPLLAKLTPDGSRLYVTDFMDNNIWVIDTATSSVFANVAVGLSPVGLAITPQALSMTGLWYNHLEEGWGVNVVRQYSIAFVTMFTYGPSGLPTWYVASSCAISPRSPDRNL